VIDPRIKQKSHLSEEQGSVFLPNARRAVEGLRAVQDGFFLTSRVTDEGVLLPDANGVDRTVTKHDAARQWLQVLRNATHGFKSKKTKHWRSNGVLLVAHNGRIPEGLPFLPYLYLLQLMADPSRVSKMVANAAKLCDPPSSPAGSTSTDLPGTETPNS
jgi:hypothetical protein